MKQIIRRNMNRLFMRFSLLCVSVILGAIAVGQAQRGLTDSDSDADVGEDPLATASVSSGFTAAESPRPMPLSDRDRTDPIPDPSTFAQTQQVPDTHAAAQWADDSPADDYGSQWEGSRATDQYPAIEPPANVPEPAYHDDSNADSAYQDDPVADAAYSAAGNVDQGYAEPGYAEPGYGAAAYSEPGYEEAATHLVSDQTAVRQTAGTDADGYVTELDPTTGDYGEGAGQAGHFEEEEPTDGYAESPIESPAPVQGTPNLAPTPLQAAPFEPGRLGGPDDRQDGPVRQDEQVAYNNRDDLANRQGSGSLRYADDRSPPPLSDVETQSEPPQRFVSNRDQPIMDTAGSGRPDDSLEGRQTPSLSIVKTAPAEIQIGKPATFEITVRNVGSVPAHDVVIRDEVPHGTELHATNPTAGRASDGAVVWEMGSVKPDEEVTVLMEVLPTEEGEIGSVATVSFQASASAKSISTRPELEIEHSCPARVLVGEEVIFSIIISNPGTGDATNVVVVERVPDGLRHSSGSELEYEIGTLHRGETRQLELTLVADQDREVENVLVARSDGDLVADDLCRLEVVAPALSVSINGPGKRYLNRPAVYELTVANPGTAVARNVDLTASLPRGLKFVSTNHEGEYDSRNHLVRWSLEELPAREEGTVELLTMPSEIGQFKIRVQGTADLDLKDATDQRVEIDGIPALLFNVSDISDPIELGGETTYEVIVVNQGSKDATNLRLVAELPAGLEALDGVGPTNGLVENNRVVFAPLACLAPQDDTTYKIRVKGIGEGNWRFSVQLASDEVPDPVTKEESTEVYADQ